MPALPEEISDVPRYRALSPRRDEATRRARASQSAHRLLTAAFVAAAAVVAVVVAAPSHGIVVVLVALVGVCVPALVAAVRFLSEAASDVQRAARLVAGKARMPELVAAVEASDLRTALAPPERALRTLRHDASAFRQIRTAASRP